MPRPTSLDKFLNVNNPAFELNGYVVTVVRGTSTTTVYLFDPDAFQEALAVHAEQGRFPGGTSIDSVVGYIGRFDFDGGFLDGDFLKVAHTDDDGYYLRSYQARRPKYVTYKSLVEAASRQSPEFTRRRKLEQEQKSDDAAVQRQREIDAVRELPTSIPSINSWVFSMRADYGYQTRQVRNALEAIVERASHALAILDSHPHARLDWASVPTGQQITDLFSAVGERNRLIHTMFHGPFFPLFAGKELDD